MDLLKKYIDYAAMESKELRDLVSSDISKPSDPSPPFPNKIESWANWVKMSAFLATTLLGGGGGEWGDDGWTQSRQKIVVRRKVQRKISLKGFLTHSQVLLFSVHCSSSVNS